MAVVLFMSSSLNAVSIMEEDNNACSQIAGELQGDLEGQGVPKQVANEVANLVYEICANA